MKTLLLLILLTISLKPISAQTSLTFIEVDSTTYNAYLKGDWDRIIELGKQALEQDIDYYYLRMRMAYAFYMKTRYRIAIPHYTKALEFNNKDVIALEYLYRCYLYGGRENDAEKLVNQFPDTLKNYFRKKNSKIFTDIGIYATIGSGASESLKDEVSQTVPGTEDGSQILPNSFMNYTLTLGHRIGRSVIFHHSANLLYKNEYALSVVNSTSYISESQIIRQFNYHLGVDITPIQGLTFTPTFSYINYRIPIFYEYGHGSGKDREVYTYNTYHETAYGLKASGQFGIINIALAGSHSDLNLGKQNTGAVSFTIFPLANLNLYYSGNAYLHFQNQNSNTEQQFIQLHKIGGKVLTNLWVEGSAMIGGFTNLCDPFSGLVYNSLEKYKSIIGVNFIVPFHKSGISLFAGYRYSQSESMFVPFDNIFEYSNIKSFSYHSIIGGISWKL